jgi:DNA-binding transcriptional MerR regulator
MTKTYSISQLAEEFEVTSRTIRFYEEKGLLSPKRKGMTREYGSAERVKLMLILRGKRLGFSLEESGNIIGLYDQAKGNMNQLQHLLEGIEEKQTELMQKRKEINSMLADLKQAKDNCLVAMQNHTKK